jgi:hypothetical protein
MSADAFKMLSLAPVLYADAIEPGICTSLMIRSIETGDRPGPKVEVARIEVPRLGELRPVPDGEPAASPFHDAGVPQEHQRPIDVNGCEIDCIRQRRGVSTVGRPWERHKPPLPRQCPG